jgi:hypothetical protein
MPKAQTLFTACSPGRQNSFAVSAQRLTQPDAMEDMDGRRRASSLGSSDRLDAAQVSRDVHRNQRQGNGLQSSKIAVID